MQEINILITGNGGLLQMQLKLILFFYPWPNILLIKKPIIQSITMGTQVQVYWGCSRLTPMVMQIVMGT